MHNLELFFKSGQKFAKYDGQEYRVRESLKNEYIVIDGRRVNLNNWFGDNNEPEKYSSNLTEHPQKLVNYYDGLIEKNKKKINYLKAKGEALKAQFKGVQKQYYELLSKFGVDKYSDIDDEAQKAEAKKFYSDLSDLRMAKTANSNREYSAYMRAFDYALEKKGWLDHFNLVKYVQNSIWS